MIILFRAVIIYILLVFVASRFVVPFMGWGGFVAPRRIPEEVKAAIADLEVRATDQRTYLEAVFELIMEKNQSQWNHTRFRAAFNIPRAFVKDLSEIWETKGFVYCTAMNYLAAALLVNSKYFSAGGGSASGGKAHNEDIRVKHVFVNFFIHQYLQVRVGNNWIDFDPAGVGIRGQGLGKHLSFFG